MKDKRLPLWFRIMGTDRVLSLRVIASLAVAALVAGTLFAIAHLNEKYTRRALLNEAESRMLLEARNLALLSQDAMLTEFPELTLVPLVTELQESNPEVVYVVIVDHRGIIQGSADARSIGQPFQPLTGLSPCTSDHAPNPLGQVLENDKLRIAEAPIQRPGEKDMGRAIVGIDKDYIEAKILQARKDLFTYAAILLPVAMGFAALLMTLLLRPISRLRAGLERIGQGDLDSPMEIRDPTELGILARSINKMASQLKASRREIREREREIVATQKEIIHTLGDVVESRSSETANHTLRVGAMSMKLAELAGLSPAEANLVRMASPMHDVGKIGIPDSILNKPGKLTREEYDVMKSHAVIGYRILAKSDRVILQAAAVIAHEHHERWDGTGYPRGLAGEDIHIFGRIVSLVDVFDAVYSDRVYRPAMELEQAVEIIRKGRGNHFDPQLADLFLGNLDAFLEIHGQFDDIDRYLEALTPMPAEKFAPEPEPQLVTT